jgi:hypothetical protein
MGMALNDEREALSRICCYVVQITSYSYFLNENQSYKRQKPERWATELPEQLPGCTASGFRQLCFDHSSCTYCTVVKCRRWLVGLLDVNGWLLEPSGMAEGKFGKAAGTFETYHPLHCAKAYCTTILRSRQRMDSSFEVSHQVKWHLNG